MHLVDFKSSVSRSSRPFPWFMRMEDFSWGLIIGISLGVIVGVVLAISILFCIRYRRRCFQIGNCSSRRATAIPIRINGVDSSRTMSDSTIGQETPRTSGWNDMSLWLEGLKRRNAVPLSGIPKYSYKDLQKATYNFTTEVGQEAFGPVYKAEMSAGETVAVKVLATNSTRVKRSS